MPTGLVQFLGKSRTGKPTVTIDGQIYSASKVELGPLKVGDVIDFESASSVYNGATVWFLNAWKPSGGSKIVPAPTHHLQSNAAPSAPAVAHNRALGISEGERLTISNWVAAAIQAGKVEGPADLTAWASGALHAIRGAGNPDYVPF